MSLLRTIDNIIMATWLTLLTFTIPLSVRLILIEVFVTTLDSYIVDILLWFDDNWIWKVCIQCIRIILFPIIIFCFIALCSIHTIYIKLNNWSLKEWLGISPTVLSKYIIISFTALFGPFLAVLLILTHPYLHLFCIGIMAFPLMYPIVLIIGYLVFFIIPITTELIIPAIRKWTVIFEEQYKKGRITNEYIRYEYYIRTFKNQRYKILIEKVKEHWIVFIIIDYLHDFDDKDAIISTYDLNMRLANNHFTLL